MAIYYGPAPLVRDTLADLDGDDRVRIAASGSFLDAEPACEQ